MSDFDRYDRTYEAEVQKSIDFVGQDTAFFTEVKADELVRIAGTLPGGARALSALDVGAGTGATDTALRGRFGRLAGVDVARSMAAAARRANPGCAYAAFDGARLPFGSGAFDVVFAINVFHHVPREARRGLLDEMLRATRPGGLTVVFEHNPFNPLTRRAVGRCPFDADAVLLRRAETTGMFRAAGADVRVARYILFFPWRGTRLRTTERFLRWLPLGAQYVVAARPRAEHTTREGGDR